MPTNQLNFMSLNTKKKHFGGYLQTTLSRCPEGFSKRGMTQEDWMMTRAEQADRRLDLGGFRFDPRLGLPA